MRVQRDLGVAPRPRVSVVLGSFNRLRLLTHAIDSVRAQIPAMEREIIVVDGGSSDGSVAWLTAQHDIVTIIQHNRTEVDGRKMMRGSWGYFMNLAFRSARADHVLMISDDTVVLPGAVDTALRRFDELAAAGRKIGGMAFYFRDWPSETEYYVQKTLGGRLMVNHGLFAKQALEKVGYIDEDTYLFYKADGDLSLRIWQAGYEIVDVPGGFVEHYLDPGEEVRQRNNRLLDHDRRQYFARWSPIFGKSMFEAAGRITVAFEDQERTAERVFSAMTEHLKETTPCSV